MKLFLFLSLLLLGLCDLNAQQPNIYAFRENIEPATPIKQRFFLLRNTPPKMPTKLRYTGNTLEYSYIENPAIRYAISSLKLEKQKDNELNTAINTLLNYLDDRDMQNIISKIKKYSEETQTTTAFEILNKAVVNDSLSIMDDYDYAENDSTIYYNSEINTLRNFIHTDPNFLFIQKIRCDSVPVDFYNVGDQSIRFWINNGRSQYYRFWALNNGGDSVGTWIQVIPRGHALKLTLDNNVYTQNIEHKETKITALDNKPTDVSLHDIYMRELNRRYWSYYWDATLAFGQGYQSNWSGGGENSISLLNNVKFVANYAKDRLSWENYIRYRLGFLKSSSTSLRKNEEIFELNTKIGEQAFGKWYYTGQLNIQSSFFNTYKYYSNDSSALIGNLFSPTNITLSVGLDYKKKNFSLFISPLAGKWTTVQSDQITYYGMEKKIKSLVGASIELKNSFKLYKTANINNELKIFSSYNDNKNKFNLNWKVDVNMQISYFMQTVVYLYVVYDEAYNSNPQFKETLNLAFNFRF